MIKIEKGIPLPPKCKGSGRPEIYPFSKMVAGDSFFVGGVGHNKVTSSLQHAKKKYGALYAVRKEKGGVRVFCLATKESSIAAE